MAEKAYHANGPMARIIKRLARKHRVPHGEVVRRSVLLMKYLSDRSAVGDTIIVRDLKTGESVELKMAA